MNITEIFDLLKDWDGVIAALSGAVIGAWLSLCGASRQERERQTIEMVKMYQSIFYRYAHVINHLNNWVATGTTPQNKDAINEIIEIGNWFEIFSALIVSKKLDVQWVTNMGLKEQVCTFWLQVSEPVICNNLNAYRHWINMKKLCAS